MPAADGGSHHAQREAEAGLSLVELIVTMGVLSILMALVFQSMSQLVQSTSRDSTQSYVTSKARAAVENVTRSLRDDFVMFNIVGTPEKLGVNFDLNDPPNNKNKPVVRDGILYYFDSVHKAQIYPVAAGAAFSAGLTDQDQDLNADVIGIGLVPQHMNGDWKGPQDIIDLDHDGVADDLDGDGNPDALWTLTMVRFNKIADVTNPDLWRGGQILATNVYIQRIDPAGDLSGPNISVFRFSAHNPTAMLYDLVDAPYLGNGNNIVEENELGNMDSVDGIINAANEVAAIDSITLTLNVVEVAREGLGQTVVLSGDISSDLVTPRTLALIRRNGIVALPNPTQGPFFHLP